MIRRALAAAGRREPSPGDADFDVLGKQFDAMYSTSWGEVRLAVLWDHLIAVLPELGQGGKRVLDAGGGGGRIAIRLAELGNDVTLCDPSRAMLDRAEEAIQEAGLTDAITIAQARIQDLGAPAEPFDVVACHGVLEWLAAPRAALEQLVRSLKPDGHLSLMFSNRSGWVLKRVLRGGLGAALAAMDADEILPLRAKPRRFATLQSVRRPVRPPAGLDEKVVRRWLGELGCSVEAKAGIRIFHDYLEPETRSPEWLDKLLAVETAYCSVEPFASLGQQTHLVCTTGRS